MDDSPAFRRGDGDRAPARSDREQGPGRCEAARPAGQDAAEDGLTALVRWRLTDPGWTADFDELLDDATTCATPEASCRLVLAALGEAVRADGSLAPRAQILAEQARFAMAAKALREAPAAPLPARLLDGLRKASGLKKASMRLFGR